jgi:hypothetical protein
MYELIIDEMIILKLTCKIVFKFTIPIQLVHYTGSKLTFVGTAMDISVP